MKKGIFNFKVTLDDETMFAFKTESVKEAKKKFKTIFKKFE